jgi:hypothetical protein
MFDQVSSDAAAFDPEPSAWLDHSDPDPDRREGLGTFIDYLPEYGGEWS